MVAELVLHLAEQDPPRVHVGLRDVADGCVRLAAAFPAHRSLHGRNLLSFVVVQELHHGEALHHARRRVAQELAPGLEGAVDADLVLGGHVEIARLRGVVGGLLGDVVALGVIRVFPKAGEGLAEDGVEGLLDAAAKDLASKTPHAKDVLRRAYIRRLDVPSAQIKLHNGKKSLRRVVDRGHRQQRLWVGHEAVQRQVSATPTSLGGGETQTHLVIRSSIDRGSRINVGSVIRLRSAPGRSCEMMWVSTAERARWSVQSLRRRTKQLLGWRRTIALLRVDDSLIVAGDGRVVVSLVDGRAVARQRVSSMSVAEHHDG